MKALTLTQPWATLVACGVKRVETRSWGTSYRGRVAIHAAKGMPRWCVDLLQEEPFATELRNAGAVDIPRGFVVGIAELKACRRMTEEYVEAMATTNPLEFALGDYAVGRYAWDLSSSHWYLLDPIPARGALGLWEWDRA